MLNPSCGLTRTTFNYCIYPCIYLQDVALAAVVRHPAFESRGPLARGCFNRCLPSANPQCFYSFPFRFFFPGIE